MYILLKPLFSRHKGIGVQFTDEPTGNLDSKTSADVMGLIKRTSYEFHQTVVMITHNNEIARLADRIVEYSGRFYTSIPEIGNRRSDVKETALPF